MITPAYVHTMARYNAHMNTEVYAAAQRLGDDERQRPRGAFWGSILGTLSHLLWTDQAWMSRFAGWEAPAGTLKQSATYRTDFAAMLVERPRMDRGLLDWARALDPAWLQSDHTWFSGSAQRDVTLSRPLLVTHMFNHQTHHRGQAHAMITAAGERTGDTDLWLLG